MQKISWKWLIVEKNRVKFEGYYWNRYVGLGGTSGTYMWYP